MHLHACTNMPVDCMPFLTPCVHEQDKIKKELEQLDVKSDQLRKDLETFANVSICMIHIHQGR